MCIAPNGTASTPRGQRSADGSFTRNSQLGVGAKWADRHGPQNEINATNVPLGDGMAASARLSIMARRERIRQAVEK